jgi:hypothetical protein
MMRLLIFFDNHIEINAPFTVHIYTGRKKNKTQYFGDFPI